VNKKSPSSAFLAAFLIGGLVLASAICFGAVQASTGVSSIPKPSVPQFSIQVVDHSYDVPTTYSTDPYTGKQITNPGYHVDDIRVEGKIKNQHFTPYTIPNPNSTSSYDTDLKIDFYYDIRYKGHFGGEWMKLYGSEDVDFLKQNYGSEYTNFTASKYNAVEFQDGAQVDFQVRAVIGFETWGFVVTWPYRILNGEDSGWSNTLTVAISKNTTSSNTYAATIDGSPYPTLTSPQTFPTPTPSPSTTPTPEQTPPPSPTNYTGVHLTEQEIIAGAAITAAVIVAFLGLLIYLIKRK
jgi:hypothetical protein